MKHVTSDQISRHLHQSASMVFVGDGQSVTVAGNQNNATFVLDGAPSAYNWPTADLTISNPAAFHGTVDMGVAAQVTLSVWASSYSYDASHDLLSLYQGDKVVDTLKVDFHGGAQFPSYLQSGGPASNWTSIATGYHGLSYGISEHVPV